jgi:hypothetical protein
MLGLATSLIHGGVQRKFTNYSGSFDGTADFVLLPEVAALKPTATLSLSFWAKANDWDPTSNATDVFVGCLRSGGWLVRLRTHSAHITIIEGLISVANNGSTSPGYLTATLNTATTEALTGWNHLVMTYDGTTLRLYVNGGTTGVTNGAHGVGSTQAINYHSSTATPIMLGADASNDTDGAEFYHGLLDDVAIWDAALDAAAITAVYNSGVPFDLTADKGNYDNSGDLIGYWLFEEGTGTSVADSSTNSNNGGVGNAWSWSTDVPE